MASSSRRSHLKPLSSEGDDETETQTQTQTVSESDDESSEAVESPLKAKAPKPVEDKQAATRSEKKGLAKRPRESDDSEKYSEDKKKRQESEESKKPPFQKIWSDNDEIALLNCLIDYGLCKNGIYDFINKSLQKTVPKKNIKYKIRQLKEKYQKNTTKNEYTPINAHDQKLFELSKKLWTVNDNDQGSNNNNHNQEAAPTSKSIKLDSNSSWTLISKMINLSEHAMHNIIESIPKERRAEIDAKWGKLHVDELELFLKKNELVNEQVKLALEEIK